MAEPTDPRHSGRFKKGETGNRNGRPRKAKPNEDFAFEVILNKTFTVMRSGVLRELTAEEALQRRTYEAAITGSRMAQRAMLRMIIKRERARAAKLGVPIPQVTWRTEPEDPQNADVALQILGIAKRKELGGEWKHDRDYLLLEPWAVQAALTRRRGRRVLDERDKNEVRRCTFDSDKLRWPRKDEG